MSIESTLEGGDKGINSTKQKRLDWDRINYFASLTPDEVSKEAFRLTTCPSIYCLPGHKGCSPAKKVKDPGEVVVITDQVPGDDKRIPPINETHSLDDIASMPSTTTDSTPYPAPNRRSFRQRRDIQLRPYTVDRMKHQSLLYGKRSSTPSGTAASRAAKTPLSKSHSHLSSTQDSFLLDDQSYMESLSSDSDGDFIDGLDFENLDILDDMDKASQLSGDSPRGSNNIPDTINDDEDSDTDEQPYRRKRRRFRIIDDGDDDEDGEATTTPAPVDQINTTNSDKDSDIDIFAFPSYDTAPPITTYHQNKPPNKLITYKRSKDKKRSLQLQHRNRKTASTSITDKSVVGTNTKKDAAPSNSHSAKDVFDFEAFGDLDQRGGGSVDSDVDMGTATSVDTPMDTDNDTSTPGSPQPTTSQKALSTRQKRHNAAQLNGDDRHDDSGFVVDEDDGHEERRRNTTLHEVRKYKRTLKGILPHSFVKVFQQQLDHEEHHIQRRPRPRPAPRHLDSGVIVDNDNSNSGQPSTGDVLDIWDAVDDELCPTERSLPTPEAPTDIQHAADLSDQTLEQALKHQQHQEQKYQEQEELMQRQKRHLIHDSFTVDFGLPTLRHGALCGNRLNYLETKAFSTFSVSYQPSSWDNVFDQRFSVEDYFLGSPKIVSLFHLAFQQFYVMWHTPDCIDTTIPIDPRKVLRATPLLGFLRFVSGCLSKCNDKGGDMVSTNEMKQFLVCQMDAFVDRVLAIVHWTDASKMELRGTTDHYTTLPLLLVLFYCVEWSFQLRRFPTVSSHWTMETTLRRLLWYLLSLGPLSVMVVSTGTYEFSVANHFVAEAWILLLQLSETDSPGDTFLWKCLEDFMKTMTISDSQGIHGNGTTMTVWQKNELTWQWIMTITLLQRLQKNEDRLVTVCKSTERIAKTRCFDLLSQVLNDISQQKVHTPKPTAIGSSNTPTISKSQLIDRFYAMTTIRLTFVRYHLLMVKYRWMWDNKTIQQLFNLAQSQALQTFTGDPHHSTQLRYQATDTTTQYFPLYFTNYNGTIPDDQVDATDSCGTLFMKILSLGLWRTVDQILELHAQGNHEGSTQHRDQLKKCLVRLSPSYLVVSGSSTGSASHMLTAMVSASSHNNNTHQPDPFVTFAYYYLINMAILHATARLGKDDNTGLKVQQDGNGYRLSGTRT
ncbi:hypothetical protein [Absidia glauca]|uniref:Uncharacterized protein n=1 Tax=Absidia glauca TaxID=4829 RepID=A0A163KNH7_ABSGL|nr:hypothetical protein [Absidia glauca]